MAKKLAVILGVVFLLVLGFIFSIDQNPRTIYYPTDGLKMVVLHDTTLKDREGTDGPFLEEAGTTKASLVQYFGMVRTPKAGGISIAAIHYRPAPYPGFVRTVGSWFGWKIADPKIEYEFLSLESGQVWLQDKSGNSSSTVEYTSDAASSDFVRRFAHNLQNLESNGELRLHSDFVVVEAQGRVRAYLLDHLPANVKVFYDFQQQLDKKIHLGEVP